MLWVDKLKDRLRALASRIAALEAQLQEAMARNDALSTRLEEAEREWQRRWERERHDDQSASVAQLAEAVGRLEGLVAEQAAALALHADERARQASELTLQAAALEALGEAGERQERTAEQLRSDLVRTQRQAELDLAEMRETNAAVAASVLLRRREPADNV